LASFLTSYSGLTNVIKFFIIQPYQIRRIGQVKQMKAPENVVDFNYQTGYHIYSVSFPVQKFDILEAICGSTVRHGVFQNVCDWHTMIYSSLSTM